MSRKQCFDQKCINCIKSIVKQQLSECMDISMCINNDMVINGDLTVNGNVYYETIDVSNICVGDLSLGAIYLGSDCRNFGYGNDGQVLVSRGGLPNEWIDINLVNGIRGATGATGIKGDTGVKGDTGLKGDTGIQGPTEITGSTGITGGIVFNTAQTTIRYGVHQNTTVGNNITENIYYGHIYSNTEYSLQISLYDNTTPIDNIIHIHAKYTDHCTYYMKTGRTDHTVNWFTIGY
jgi:hypothetical protein